MDLGHLVELGGDEGEGDVNGGDWVDIACLSELELIEWAKGFQQLQWDTMYSSLENQLGEDWHHLMLCKEWHIIVIHIF